MIDLIRIDRITDAKELVKVERQIAKVEAILEQLEARRAALLAALGEKINQ